MYEPTDGLMLPSVRRQMAAVQSQKIEAERVRRKVLAEAVRTEFIVQHRYPAGMLGVDSPMLPTTELYRNTHDTLRSTASASNLHSKTRCGNVCGRHCEEACPWQPAACTRACSLMFVAWPWFTSLVG